MSDRYSQQLADAPAKYSWDPVPAILACSLLLIASMFAIALSAVSNDYQRYAPAEDSSASSSSNSAEASASSASSSVLVAQETTIGEYKSSSQGVHEGRANNIMLASSALNDQVVEPGATFSFIAAVGDIQNDSRYQYAPVINNGTSVGSELGGGICQVSTALYIAALCAGMEISERHPHTMTVDYSPLGLDATVYEGVADLKFVNTSSHPVTIKARSEGQIVTVSLVGYPLEDNLLITVTSKIIGYYDAEGKPTEISASNDTITGETHCSVRSYRQYYRDGQLANEELLAEDTYLVARSISTPSTGGEANSNK